MISLGSGAVGAFGLFTFLIAVPTLAFGYAYSVRRLQMQERLRMIERGMIPNSDDGRRDRIRLLGIVLLAVGAGLGCGGVLLVKGTGAHISLLVPLGLCAIAVLPGTGLLIDYLLQKAKSADKTQGDL